MRLWWITPIRAENNSISLQSSYWEIGVAIAETFLTSVWDRTVLGARVWGICEAPSSPCLEYEIAKKLPVGYSSASNGSFLHLYRRANRINIGFWVLRFSSLSERFSRWVSRTSAVGEIYNLERELQQGKGRDRSSMSGSNKPKSGKSRTSNRSRISLAIGMWRSKHVF